MIIVVAHQKGGVGKSTIAANLCVYLEAPAIDLDYQRSVSIFAQNRRATALAPLAVSAIETFADLKKALTDAQDDIIVDCGGFDSDLNRLAIVAADIIVTPVGDSSLELHGLIRFGEILKDIRQSTKNDIKAFVLLNRVHSFANASLETLRKEISQMDAFVPLDSDLRDRADYKRAFAVGKSVGEFARSSAADMEMQALIRELANIAADRQGLI
jgi:chromosome partitioning protein